MFKGFLGKTYGIKIFHSQEKCFFKERPEKGATILGPFCTVLGILFCALFSRAVMTGYHNIDIFRKDFVWSKNVIHAR